MPMTTKPNDFSRALWLLECGPEVETLLAVLRFKIACAAIPRAIGYK